MPRDVGISFENEVCAVVKLRDSLLISLATSSVYGDLMKDVSSLETWFI